MQKLKCYTTLTNRQKKLIKNKINDQIKIKKHKNVIKNIS